MTPADPEVMALTRVDDPGLLTDRVAEALREAIRSRQIPPGSKLSVPELARQLGVSRTPAREALVILERDGLVEVHPRRGAVVLHGNRDDLVQLFELREALDGMAARLAAMRATPEERRSLSELLSRHVAALRAGDVDEYLQLDLQFHLHVCQLARNRRLSTVLEQLRDQVRVVMHAGVGQPGPIGRDVIRDHRAIASAIGDRDPDAAEAAARRHVRNVSAYAIHPKPPVEA